MGIEKIDFGIKVPIVLFCFVLLQTANAQWTEVTLGQGNNDGVTVTASSSTPVSTPDITMTIDGFSPNLNAASRFLAQATLGYNYEEIEHVANIGFEAWIDAEFQKPIAFPFIERVIDYHEYMKAGENDPDAVSQNFQWENAWWHYHMTSTDHLRQRVAFALSELLVISKASILNHEPYAFATYYDFFMQHAFGNYRDILQDVTYHPAMGSYLTYLNNPKTDPAAGTYPDENYAREIMQLFTIGLLELNNDGSYKLDGGGDEIPTYTNYEIGEFSKVFTGLSWVDRPVFGKRYPLRDSSYMNQMLMWNDHHEPGVKNLLNGFQVPNRVPVDGDADITDALDNLFNHPNVGPFISKYFIQRLVTSNPSPDYIDRVATVFNDNGSGVRGDMKAMVKAILLDPSATNCASADDPTFGMLREPFIRYVQISKAFDNSTLSGEHRNFMPKVFDLIQQLITTSPSVFNFFQSDHQPIGAIVDQGLVAPEFQITNSSSISGYIDGLYQWVFQENPAQEYDLYTNEPDADYDDEIAMLDFSDELVLAGDDKVHMLVDRLNLLLAQGRLSQMTEDIITEAVMKFPSGTNEELEQRAKFAVYLLMSSPEYLINR